MDWFSWLSKTSLDPSLAYEYGLAFAHNELEHEDIIYFNHEFLQSMGISIAKHRLEILKLAKNKQKLGRKTLNSVSSRLIVAIKKTKKSLSNYFHSLIHKEKSSLVVVPTRSRSWNSTNNLMKRKRISKKVMMKNNSYDSNYHNKQERLLLTNGSSAIVPSTICEPIVNGFSISSSKVFNLKNKVKNMERDEEEDDDDDGYWSAALEDIRWDTMFHDLKPN